MTRHPVLLFLLLLPALSYADEQLPQFATRRFGTARFAHGDRIMDVGLSRDGQRFVTLGMGDARVFDREGKLLQTFPAANFSGRSYGGGRYVTISGRNEGAPPNKLEMQVELKNIETGKTDKTLSGFSHNIQAVTSPDDKLLAVIDYPGVLHVIDAASGSELDKQPLKVDGKAGDIGASRIVFAGDNSSIVMQLGGGRVQVIALKDGKLGKVLYEQGETAFGPLAVSASGKRLATLVKGEGVVVRELPSAKAIFTLDANEFRGSILGGCFVGEDKLAICSADSTIRVYPLEGLEPKPLRLYAAERHVHCLAYDTTGRRLVSGGGRGKLRFWNTETGDAIPLPGLGEVYEPAASIAVSSDEKWLALQGDLGHTFLWNMTSGQLAMRTKDPPVPATHYDPHVMPHRLAFSKDNKWLVSGSSHLATTAQVLDLTTGKVAKEVTFRWPVMALALSPDGKLGVASSRQNDLILFRRETGETVIHFEKFEGAVHIEFAGDGKTVVALRGSDIASFNVDEGMGSLTVHPLPLHATAMTLVPESNDVVVACQKCVLQRLSLDTGKEAWSTDRSSKPPAPGPQPQETYADVAASRDGKWLAAAGRDGTIGVFSLADGKALGELKGHIGPVRSLAWSQASPTRLYSGGGDSTVIEWDVDQLLRKK